MAASSKSVIVVLSLDFALWGFSLMMFGITMYLICRGRSLQEINYWNVTRSCLLLTGSTIHVSAIGTRAVNAFAAYTGFPGSPEEYLSHIHPESIIMCAAYCFQTLLGDAIVIHRCYVVWQSVWVAIVPITIWLGTLGFSISVLRNMVLKLHNDETSLGLFMIPVFALTLSANFVSTGLLAFRIHRINRNLTRLGAGVMKSTIYPFMRTAIDTGALYTVLLIVVIINQILSSDPFELSRIIVPCISIIFYMFIMRIALGQTSPSSRAPNRHSSRSRTTNHQIQFPVVETPMSSAKMSECVTRDGPECVKEGQELGIDEHSPPSSLVV